MPGHDDMANIIRRRRISGDQKLPGVRMMRDEGCGDTDVAALDTTLRIGEFQPIRMHPGADGTEIIEPLHYEPEPVSRKRRIRRD